MSLLIIGMLVWNRAIYVMGLKAEKILKRDIGEQSMLEGQNLRYYSFFFFEAACKALQEFYSELYQHMTADAEIEEKALKDMERKLKVTTADIKFQIMRRRRYKRTTLGDMSANSALEGTFNYFVQYTSRITCWLCR